MGTSHPDRLIPSSTSRKLQTDPSRFPKWEKTQYLSSDSIAADVTGARAVATIPATNKTAATAIKEIPQNPVFHNSAGKAKASLVV